METVKEDNNEPAPPSEQPEPEPTQEQDEPPTPILRRSTRTTRTKPDRWTYSHNHKQSSMVTPCKLNIRFMEQALYELEDKHNLNCEGIKANGRDIEYEPQMALLIALHD